MSINQIPAPQALYTRMALVTSTGTWSHPDGYGSPRPVKVLVYNGGFGGFAGRAQIFSALGSAGSNNGGGGSSGYVFEQDGFITSDLSITVGAGGSGQSNITATTTSVAGVPTAVPGIPGTTIVTGTGMNINISTTSVHQLVYSNLNMVSSNILRGVSGGGAGDRSAFTTALIGGSNGFGGQREDGQETNTTRQGTSILPSSNNTAFGFMDALIKYSNGGGGGGGCFTTAGSAGVGSRGGAGALGLSSGGTGGAAAVGIGADATANAGGTGGAFGGGGGGGGGAFVVTTNISRTVTSGAGGDGGAGGVVIFF